MVLNDYIIGYSKIDKEKYILHIKCEKCGEKFEKTIKNNKVSLIKCEKCKSLIVFIPVEVNGESGEIIDFYDMTYYEYSKHIKEWEEKKKDSIKDLDKKEIDRLKLNYITNILLTT